MDETLLVLYQLLNVVWLNGSQDETVSSHIGRTGKHKWLRNILKRYRVAIASRVEESRCQVLLKMVLLPRSR